MEIDVPKYYQKFRGGKNKHVPKEKQGLNYILHIECFQFVVFLTQISI